MPLVDVTEILTDPDVAGQEFTVLRRQEVVNSFGESTWSTARIMVTGSVQPSGDQGLIREEGLDAQAKSIEVYTTYRLRGVAKGPDAARWKPDIVVWNNNHFEVVNVDSFSSFGAGFVKAECTSVHYVDLPPANLPPEGARLDFTKPTNSPLSGGN